MSVRDYFAQVFGAPLSRFTGCFPTLQTAKSVSLTTICGEECRLIIDGVKSLLDHTGGFHEGNEALMKWCCRSISTILCA